MICNAMVLIGSELAVHELVGGYLGQVKVEASADVCTQRSRRRRAAMPEYRNFWRRKELGVTVHWDDIVAAGRAIIIVNHLGRH